MTARTTTSAPPVPHRGATILWTVVVPALVTLAGSALALSWRDELPDRVASHWGRGGGVDGYSTLSTLLLGLGGLTLAFCAFMALVGTLAGRASMSRRFTCGMAVWFAVFLQAVLLSTLAPQRGLTDPSAAPDAAGGLGVALVVACLAAIAVAWAVPGDEAIAASATPPPGALRLDLGASEHAVWVGEVGQRGVVVGVVGAALLATVVSLASGLWLFGVVLGVILVAVMAATLRWTVTVDARGLTARSLLRRPRVHVPLAEVEGAEVVDVDPMREFGGWGLRIGLDGRTGVVLRGGPAIQVRRSGGRVVVVTVDDAATGAALLNTLAERGRASTGSSG
ncbi:DUF1648 domain-containing protein [Actinotalea solisilvae]|uniref:DUF1648 domain-containing protein n=1 Tax=Actinotalea solisilvae TaxID=2072922 RepID=UPI0018F1B4EA|nr:DUF1648 domain-containing protein [Actinotalea solisilvae]